MLLPEVDTSSFRHGVEREHGISAVGLMVHLGFQELERTNPARIKVSTEIQSSRDKPGGDIPFFDSKLQHSVDLL